MQIRVVQVAWSSHKDQLQKIRHQVFCEEQGVPRELDEDGQDAEAIHTLAVNEAGQPIGCARLLPEGKIGRMAVLFQWRGQGIGAQLLANTITAAKTRGLNRVTLHAQTTAQSFYQKHGFINIGGEFVEAGIPHRAMQLALSIPGET